MSSPPLSSDLITKHDILCRNLRTIAPHGIALAFSGGVDSTFLLHILASLRDELAFPLSTITVKSSFIPLAESDSALAIAQQYNVPSHLIKFNPLDIPEVQTNSPDRCYACKFKMFSLMLEIASKSSLEFLVDGTNADDLHVFRPGLRALHELNILSPLATAHLSKSDIRLLAESLNLPCAKQPSTPCLATRFSYYTHLTPQLLAQVDAGESYIRSLLPPNANLRLRVHDSLARIETSPDNFRIIMDNRSAISDYLHAQGFDFVSIDIDGFRSGSFDTNVH